MRKLITFCVVALILSLSTTMWASEPTLLHVHQTDGEIYSVSLSDVSLLTFADNDLLINATTPKQIPLSGVRKITFGAGENTAVDNLLSDAACQAFVSNGMLTVNAADGISALQVVNLAGQVVFAGQYAGSQHLEIDAQSWAQGMYIVLMQTANGSTSAKIML